MTTDGRPARRIPDAHATPARSTEQARVLAQLLNGLTADERTVLTLRIVARRSIEEAAQQLGTSPAAVRLAQHDALDQLRRELRERLGRRDEDRS
jgi:RNA polymerase sigma-70 factor (ECF subfamily)